MIWSLRVCPARLWTNFFAQNNHRQNLIHPIIWLQHPCNRWFEASRLSSQTSIFFLHKSSTISHPSNYSSPLLRMIWSLHVCPARLYNLIFVQIFIDLIPSIPRFSYSTLFADDLKTAVCPDGLWSYFFYNSLTKFNWSNYSVTAPLLRMIWSLPFVQPDFSIIILHKIVIDFFLFFQL